MHCRKYNKEVLVDDCETCLSARKCEPVCVKRGFIWGVAEGEPRWEHSYEAAAAMDVDVAAFFDPAGEGNSHLMRKISISTQPNVKQAIPSNIRWEVWERDNFTCQHCGARAYLSVDHIHPESKGGDLTMDNLQTLCRSCNSRKGAKVAGA